MLLKRLAFLLLLAPSLAFASTTTQWEVRTTGNDANGGAFDNAVTSPGTDYSQQDAAQVAFTDLVIGATTTQLTSAAHPFSSTSPGNFIHITGGTGFTTGWYEILSVSGSTATMDRSVGTAASTGGTGNLGGGLQTWAGLRTAFAASPSNGQAGNTFWIKSGTYTWTAALNFDFGNGNAFIGYNVSHGDMSSTRPLVTTSTNSITGLMVLNSANVMRFNNINFSTTAATPGQGFRATTGAALQLSNSTMSGFTTAIWGDSGGYFPQLVVTAVEISGASTTGAIHTNWNSNIVLSDLYIHGGSVPAIDFGGGTTGVNVLSMTNIIMAGNTAKCLNIPVGGEQFSIISMRNVTCSSPTGNGIDISALSPTTTMISMENVVVYGSTAYGYVGAAVTTNGYSGVGGGYFNKLAYGNNTSGNTSGFWPITGAITNTASPFTNTGTGDYSLNSTAGGGAALKGAGYPGVFPGGTTTGYLDVGAVQSQGTGGGGTAGNYGFVQ